MPAIYKKSALSLGLLETCIHFSLPQIFDIIGLSWLEHYATNRKVAGSIPDEVIF
jgi:hypothetical protein